MPALYDRIGLGYADHRRPDPRIAALIAAAIGGARSVINVGAGVGSYEPRDRSVVAVEPSRVMIAQRAPGAAPVVQAYAEALPFAEGAFDCALAVLTIHHWPDVERGVRALARVARERVLLLTWIPDVNSELFWLTDYVPEIAEMDRHLFPSIAQLAAWLGPVRVIEVPIPHDCSDGFMCAYWRRPEAYLDAGVRHAISTFARIDETPPGLTQLRADLADGTWAQRYGDLLAHDMMDFGYRVVIADRA
jgi:SAM-dependent methyltransferase